MVSLYLDTSEGLKLGLLNDEYNWVEYLELDTRRTSDVVHTQIVNLLEKHNSTIKDVDQVILMAGPGSYTGMRVAEGVAQVLELEGKRVYSFHSFRIPSFINLDSYRWCYPAFKGEIHVRKEDDSSELLLKKDFEKYVADNSVMTFITHGSNEVREFCQLDTEEKLRTEPGLIFKKVVELELRDKPFYFRPADVEFKKSSK
jgi:tRNA threonylcarbamoyladenosine biosynthesis protein TsaB